MHSAGRDSNVTQLSKGNFERKISNVKGPNKWRNKTEGQLANQGLSGEGSLTYRRKNTNIDTQVPNQFKTLKKFVPTVWKLLTY